MAKVSTKSGVIAKLVGGCNFVTYNKSGITIKRNGTINEDAKRAISAQCDAWNIPCLIIEKPVTKETRCGTYKGFETRVKMSVFGNQNKLEA